MGDPIKIRKKYHTPGHPWKKDRIEQEAVLITKYGLKNKKEIWKANTLLKNFTTQAKSLVVSEGPQSDLEKENLLLRVKSLGLAGDNPTLDTILSLKTEDILERRLQTVLFKQQLARSVGQARQFIVHHHVTVNGEKMTVPSYLVKVGDVIAFSEGSSLSNSEHPERYVEADPREGEIDLKGKVSSKKPIDEDLDVDDSLLEVPDTTEDDSDVVEEPEAKEDKPQEVKSK